MEHAANGALARAARWKRGLMLGAIALCPLLVANAHHVNRAVADVGGHVGGTLLDLSAGAENPLSALTDGDGDPAWEHAAEGRRACTAAKPCWEANLHACSALAQPACWLFTNATCKYPCSNRDPCCADSACMFRHAPDKAFDWSRLFDFRRLCALFLHAAVFILARDTVAGITILEHLKLILACSLLHFLWTPHGFFAAFGVPYFLHPAHSLKTMLSFGKLYFALFGFRKLEMIARAVFGANYHERFRYPHGPEEALATAPRQPTHWPPSLEVPRSLAARLGEICVPDEFICTITHELMLQPAITPSGTTYDYEGLARWVVQHGRYPAGEARGTLTIEQLAPNLTVRNLIQAWIQQNACENASEDACEDATSARPNEKIATSPATSGRPKSRRRASPKPRKRS